MSTPEGQRLHDRIAAVFHENFRERGELGAAVSIWHGEECVVDLFGGFRDARREQPWTEDTIVLVWSATKGLGSACLLHAMQEREIDLQRRVSEFWPEFGQKDKSEITIAQLLSHQAGLSALDEDVDVTDYEGVVGALEKQKPVWKPGDGHGYHARTFGFLVDALTRRIANVSTSVYWRNVFAEPLKLDIWIGLPAELNARVATIYAAKAGARPPSPAHFYEDLAKPGTLVRRTFTSPGGLHAVSAMNLPENRARPLVSFGGIGSAYALAKFYAMLANGGTFEGRRFFGPQRLEWMITRLSDGMDRVFQVPTAFSAGFMMNPPGGRKTFGPSATAFGQPGAGGSHAFADPENRISFAYVMNQMEQTLLPNEKSLRLVEALYGEL